MHGLAISDRRVTEQSRNVLMSTIADAPFPSSQKCSSERRGAVKGARLLRGECEPLTAGTVLDNGHRGKGGLSLQRFDLSKIRTFLLCCDISDHRDGKLADARSSVGVAGGAAVWAAGLPDGAAGFCETDSSSVFLLSF